MKKRLLSLMLVVLSSMAAWGEYGDTFTANTVEGVNVTYTVLSESPKTCQVGYIYVKSLGVRTAIDQSTSGAVTIPAVVNGYTVKDVADYSFSGCKKVTSIIIPDGVTYLGKSAFNSCEKAETIELPNSISGDSFVDRTFAGCGSLTAINIPEGVTSIGTMAFYQCTSLTSVHIPSTVTAIYEQAFYGCNNLTCVTCESETPVSISEYTFSNSSNAILYVPRGCIAEYEATDYWKDFKEIKEITEYITIGTAGMGTFCSTYPLDFSGTNDIKAYIVSAFKPSTGEVTLTRITDVPANTGIVVKGDANTYTIPWGAGETVVANMLVGVTTNTVLNKVDGDYTNYILA